MQELTVPLVKESRKDGIAANNEGSNKGGQIDVQRSAS